MTTEEDYNQWLEGRATVTDCTQQAIRILGEQITANPNLTVRERYAMALGSLTASVADDIKADLFALIRSGRD